jgi:hypothetical protein
MNLCGKSLLQPRFLAEYIRCGVMLSLLCVHGRSVGLHFIGTDENGFHDPCHHKSHHLTHTTQFKSANRHEKENRTTHVSNHSLEWLVSAFLFAFVTDKILPGSHMHDLCSHTYQHHLLGVWPYLGRRSYTLAARFAYGSFARRT